MKQYIILLLILPLFVSGCFNTNTEKTLTSTPYFNALPPFEAPNSTIKGLDGKEVKLSNYKGKPVVINFWATWCPPCRKELPSMNRAWKVFKQEKIQMIAVNMSEPQSVIEKFLKKQPIDFKVLLDSTGLYSQEWRVSGLPTTYVINSQGQVVYKAVGERQWDNPAILKTILDLAK